MNKDYIITTIFEGGVALFHGIIAVIILYTV